MKYFQKITSYIFTGLALLTLAEIAYAFTVTVNTPSNGGSTNPSFTLSASTNVNAACTYTLDSNTNGFTTTGGLSHSEPVNVNPGPHTVMVDCSDGNSNVNSTLIGWTVTNPSGGGSSGGTSIYPPELTGSQPSPLTGMKTRNATVVCHVSDSNTSNAGLNMNSAHMMVAGQTVTPVVTSTANGSLDMSYTPDSNHLYQTFSTVQVYCEITNNNGLTNSINFHFDVGTDIGTGVNGNTNATSGANANWNGNANLNGSSGTGGSTNTNSSNGNMNTAAMNTNLNSGGTVGSDYFFNDIANHWGAVYIQDLQSRCNVLGYKDQAGNLLHLFKPDNSITRAELVEILVQCNLGSNFDQPDSNPFPDVPKDHWAAAKIKRARDLGWIEGYPDGTFRPNQFINRAEALKIILLSKFNLGDIAGGSASFIDVDKNQWYYRYVAFAVLKKYVEGYKNLDGTPSDFFGPENALTRAESAKIIMNVLGTI